MATIVIGEKVLHKGQLHGAVSNGQTTLPISHNKALKFIANNDNFVTIQILDSGTGTPIKAQSWTKGKKKESQPKTKIEVDEHVEESDIETVELL